jgi:hypothetical protein
VPITTYRPELPPGLVAVIMQCFADKDPARRWQNVADFAAALAPYAPRDALPYVERIAKVRGVQAVPSRPTDLLPPEPVAAPPPSAAGAQTAPGGTPIGLTTTAVRAARRRRTSWIAAAAGSLLLALVGVATYVGRDGRLHNIDVPLPAATAGPVAPAAPPAPTSASAPVVTPTPASPTGSAASSAIPTPPVPKSGAPSSPGGTKRPLPPMPELPRKPLDDWNSRR